MYFNLFIFFKRVEDKWEFYNSSKINKNEIVYLKFADYETSNAKISSHIGILIEFVIHYLPEKHR